MERMLKYIGLACREARTETEPPVMQTDIATSARVSTATISNFENGIRWPQSSALHRIVDAYCDECSVKRRDLWARALEMWPAD